MMTENTNPSGVNPHDVRVAFLAGQLTELEATELLIANGARDPARTLREWQAERVDLPDGD